MSVYLGTFGQLLLQRKVGLGALDSVVDSADISVAKKRFSFDFDSSQILTGDQIEVTSTDGSILSFVSASGWGNGIKQTSGKWFVHVDELGGIKLYSTFANALDGEFSPAISLETIATAIPIKVKVGNTSAKILSKITSYELNTQRENVDITCLSDQFRSQYSTLMSGSGRISCEWEYKNFTGSGSFEMPHYLLQLALRTEIGSEFGARLFLKTNGYNPSGANGAADDSIWYEITGVITGAAVQFAPASIVEMTADFITTGPIRLRSNTSTPSYLLQENQGLIAPEQDPMGKIVLDTI
jgi:hypothetical protein